MRSTAFHKLVRAWSRSAHRPGCRNVLPEDEPALRDVPQVPLRSWDDYCRATDLRKRALHTHLMPMPWIGNLQTAKVFLLALNPGFGAHDYFGEHKVKPYRDALRRNLRQAGGVAFPFLDPEHSWHGGAAYWRPRLAPILEGLEGDWERCARGIAVLELVPYHSETFGLGQGTVDALESVALMRAFVRDDLLQRSGSRRCKIIVLRGHRLWGVDDLPKPHAFRSARLARRDIQEAIRLLC